MKARVFVTLKQGILDPQGKAVERALHAVGFKDVEGVRIGKLIELQLGAGSEEAARTQLAEMSRRLLANPIIEDFRFELDR